MPAFVLSLLALACVAVLMVAAPKPASAEPSVLPLAQGQTAGKVEEVGYRYRRYRYGSSLLSSTWLLQTVLPTLL
jgi:hypothetical protein